MSTTQTMIISKVKPLGEAAGQVRPKATALPCYGINIGIITVKWNIGIQPKIKVSQLLFGQFELICVIFVKQDRSQRACIAAALGG